MNCSEGTITEKGKERIETVHSRRRVTASRLGKRHQKGGSRKRTWIMSEENVNEKSQYDRTNEEESEKGIKEKKELKGAKLR